MMRMAKCRVYRVGVKKEKCLLVCSVRNTGEWLERNSVWGFCLTSLST